MRRCLEKLGLPTLVAHTPDGAPFLPESPETAISVSHSALYVAVATAPSSSPNFGIDIEDVNRPQLLKVAERFLSDTEMEFVTRHTHGLAKAWTAKEAVFKAAKHPGVDFREHIALDFSLTQARFLPGDSVFNLSFNLLFDNQMFCLAEQQIYPK